MCVCISLSHDVAILVWTSSWSHGTCTLTPGWLLETRPLPSSQQMSTPSSREIQAVLELVREREGMRDTSSFCASPPLPAATSMDLLRIAIFKRQPSFPPSDKTVIILHLHDKCVCLCTHLCMYVWVLKRTLAAVGHGFSSFISA